MRFALAGLLLLFAGVPTVPAYAQFAPCQSTGGTSGVCTCPDGVTVVSNAASCPASIIAPAPPPAAAIPSQPCPPDQYRVGDLCRCVQPGFVADAATHVCGCPAGKALTATAKGVACLGPCPLGQARDAGGVCRKIGSQG